MKALFSTTLIFSIPLVAFAFDNFKMCCLVNEERAKYGLPPLGVESHLTEAAQIQSDYMAQTRVMGHNGPQGSQPGDRADWTGYNWQSIAENVAYGYPDEETCMSMWMNSQGHRENILGDYRQFGSAVGYSGDSTPYYTQVFGSDGSNEQYPLCPSGYGGGFGGRPNRYSRGPSKRRNNSRGNNYRNNNNYYGNKNFGYNNNNYNNYNNNNYNNYNNNNWSNDYNNNNYNNGGYTWYWTSDSNDGWNNGWGDNSWNNNNGYSWGGDNGYSGITWTYY